MTVVECLYIESKDITFVTCQGDDIRLDTRVNEFSSSGAVYEALNSVYSAIPVVSITQAIFRTIRGIGSEEA